MRVGRDVGEEVVDPGGITGKRLDGDPEAAAAVGLKR
jgi:hypothetical protein